MEAFCLVDGAMVHDLVRGSKTVSDPKTPWIVALLPQDELRLAGPLLIAYTRVPQGSAQWEELGRIADAFPYGLHLSYLKSELGLEALAGHLRRFAHFRDSAGDAYGLRIADCRVLAYLPRVLTPAQWDALTAPMAHWGIHDRRGKRASQPLDDTRLERTGDTGEPQPLHLSDAQIEQLIQAGEPDALLAQVGLAPDIATSVAAAKHLQTRYETACSCIRHWQAGGGSSRAVLVDYARRVLADGTDRHHDAAWMNGVLRETKAAVR